MLFGNFPCNIVSRRLRVTKENEKLINKDKELGPMEDIYLGNQE